MSPKRFHEAWDARNDRLRAAAGVFGRIGELYDKPGAQTVEGMRPAEGIEAIQAPKADEKATEV